MQKGVADHDSSADVNSVVVATNCETDPTNHHDINGTSVSLSLIDEAASGANVVPKANIIAVGKPSDGPGVEFELFRSSRAHRLVGILRAW